MNFLEKRAANLRAVLKYQAKNKDRVKLWIKNWNIKNPTYRKQWYKKHPNYAVYWGMLQRCYNKNVPKYKFYGGKNVTVCNRWRMTYKNFVNDMGNRPKGTTLDRINPFGNYEPSNCRWATKEQQLKNTRKAWLTSY